MVGFLSEISERDHFLFKAAVLTVLLQQTFLASFFREQRSKSRQDTSPGAN